MQERRKGVVGCVRKGKAKNSVTFTSSWLEPFKYVLFVGNVEGSPCCYAALHLHTTFPRSRTHIHSDDKTSPKRHRNKSRRPCRAG
jgi:hypothetical protein